MAGTFKFELVSPERILMSVDAEEVTVPGSEGEFTVLPGHAPVISQLAPGVLHVKLTNGRKGVFVRSGFADVTPDTLTVLAERAFIVEEADPRTLDRELDLAQKALADADTDEARMHVGRAIEQLKALQAGKAA
ncbi:MAG: F0F1 ATP synthase subunit epsilon [Hyphomicrobiaceae bacterium]|nr:F0F1 ATP synthase subunit epsilon [Hyphomicrobiaceae bacterium]